jgi:hypothetical protein
MGSIPANIASATSPRVRKTLAGEISTLLFLDADTGVSEVNFFNRMHFFVNYARMAVNFTERITIGASA